MNWTTKQRIGLLITLTSLGLITTALALSENWGTEYPLYLFEVPHLWPGNTNFITQLFIPLSGKWFLTRYVIGPLVIPLFIGIMVFLNLFSSRSEKRKHERSDDIRAD